MTLCLPVNALPDDAKNLSEPISLLCEQNPCFLLSSVDLTDFMRHGYALKAMTKRDGNEIWK